MSKGPELMNRFSFYFEGERISASEGDSVAAALLNSGKYSLGERLNGKSAVSIAVWVFAMNV